MKKLLKVFLLAISLCSIVMGCVDINGNNSYIDEKNSEKAILTIAYGGERIRSILPNEWDGTTLYYKIEGESSNLYQLAPTALAFQDVAGEQQATLALEYDDWTLTLKAYKDADCTLQVLEGTAFADLTNGDTEINFILRAKNLLTPGTLNLGGTYVDDENVVTKYTMSLKNFFSGNVVETQEVTSPDETFAYTSTDNVIPGTYLFEIKFFNDADKAIGYWADEVVIDAGNTTKKTDIVIDVIMKKPASPKNLKAFLVNNSEKDEYYNVKLTWDDESTNEENFILTIKEYDIDGNELDDYATLAKDFWESQIRVSGSLLAGNTECVITLPTGRLFDFEIAAENIVGISDSDTATDGSQPCVRVDSSSDTVTDHTGYPVTNHVARVKITYNLDNGTLKFADENPISGNYIVYETYAGANINLITPDTTDINTTPTDDVPTLIKNNQPFQKWTAQDGEGTRDGTDTSKVIATNLFKNLYVTANYNTNYIVDYTIEGHQDLDSARVSATNNVDSSSCINAAIARTANGTITFAVVAEKTDEPTYTQLKVIISGSEYYSPKIVDGKLTLTVPVTDIKNGHNTINVCAYDSDKDQWYSYTFNTTIQQ